MESALAEATGWGCAVEAFVHETVLLEETVASLQPRDGGRYIDCTVGGGGHTERLLEQSSPTGRVLGLDQDESALAHARARLARFGSRVQLVHANFRHLAASAAAHGFEGADGVVFDLGVSSPQFDIGERGFSYRQDAPLDMRMDRGSDRTAAELLATLDETALANLFFEYGEEKFSRTIARRIVRAREAGPIETTGQLAEIVKSAIPAAARRTGPHPARRVFQALRIAVNDEIGALREGLAQAFEVVRAGGCIAVITFHSLEDRIVKRTFAEWCTGCTCPPEFPVCVCGKTARAEPALRKSVSPSDVEVRRNPRSRSARLRAVRKCVDA
ncbi:MAG: 16S rRNA (cytosine(1402)-N(4))-methyltransferase RsmH [Alicyclobacillus sp.]|nr:16S rRNA (cytosine(1402)-N(4))-methyltransferase RsmH [Alicyclobacillus sp.]